ncbi:MAG TPA: hypothetical protein VK915_10285 [Gaiellaceae bacterium]|nr:hypothetical protein [Gaiellaceae bacterium]
MLRGALAGIAAASAWAAVEPLAAKALRPPPGYSDVRLLGAVLTRDGPGWRAAGLGAHLANGAVFGALFARAGGRGPAQGLAAAQLENLALWPGMAVVDRIHPDRRSGAWPRLLVSPRVFAYETTVHAVFGVVLGSLLATQSSAKSES